MNTPVISQISPFICPDVYWAVFEDGQFSWIVSTPFFTGFNGPHYAWSPYSKLYFSKIESTRSHPIAHPPNASILGVFFMR